MWKLLGFNYAGAKGKLLCNLARQGHRQTLANFSYALASGFLIQIGRGTSQNISEEGAGSRS